MVQPNEDDWLFYLAQPTRLLPDFESLTNTRKITLLKQFLSQAEITDRRSNAANADNLILDTLHTDFDSQLDPVNSDVFQPYKKSKILDVLSLQIAANMKFNLNLFGITAAMPVKLMIRLCRTLVTNTARHSTALKHLFELATDRDSMFLVDPYSTYNWITLHPTTIYAIMCYHIMCFQVSLAGSLLPRPFRSFTPAVSGLTEVPASTFFSDMPVDIGGILTRILESVNQLLDIYNLLDHLNIARPFPSAFCPFESADPPILEPQADGIPESRDNDSSRLYNAQLLTREYLSATINFIIGRYDFQQHQFNRARERFELVMESMNSKQMDYLEECGATLKLVSAYLTACRSYDFSLKPYCPIQEFTDNHQLVEDFSRTLEQLTKVSSNNSANLFWLEPCRYKSNTQLPETFGKKSSSMGTLEDALCKALMDDICLLILKTPNGVSNLPLGLGLRQWLEKLCLKQFVQFSSKGSSAVMGSRMHHSPHKPNRQSKTNLHSATQASGKLFTKVHVFNALERLLSNSFELPLQLVMEILTGQLNSCTGNDTHKVHSGVVSIWDVRYAREFLIHSLHELLTVIQSRTKELVSSNYKRIIAQFMMFLVQEGISLVEESYNVVQTACETKERIDGFHEFITFINSHKIMELLPPDCVQLIKAALSKYSPEGKSSRTNLDLSGLPDPCCDIEQHTDKNLVADVDLRVELGFKNDTDTPTVETRLGSGAGDVEMLSYPSMTHHHQASGSRGHGQAGIGGLMLHLDPSSVVPNASWTRRLLCTSEPEEITYCVGHILRAGMAPDAILGLNTSWIPMLRYFIALGGPRFHPPMEATIQDPLECSLSFTSNLPTVLSVLIQLVKASIITRHQTTTLMHSRSLLLTSLSTLNPDTPGTNPTRTVQCALWIRAALRHELLLTDLLEFLNQSSMPEFPPTLSGHDQPRHKFSKKNQLMGLGSNSKIKLTSLTNRAKICILHAVGLPDNAKDLECVADSNNPVCLSNELLGASACFLLSIGELHFLQSAFTVTKHGTTSHRRPYFDSLELIRILLWLHEMIEAQPSHLKRNDEPKATLSDSGQQTKMSQKPLGRPHQQVGSKQGETTAHLDRLKAATEELHNFMIYGCLTVDHRQRKSAGPHSNPPSMADGFDHQRASWSTPGSDQCQLTIAELSSMIQYLASIIEHSDMGRSTNIKAHPETKRKAATGSTDQATPPRSISGPELLNSILACLAHLLHTVIPSISLSHWKAFNELSTTSYQTIEKLDTNETGIMKSKLARPETNTPRPAERNQSPDYSVLLMSDIWPSELSTNVQIPPKMLCELVQYVLSCFLTIQPNRIDLLALRCEIEFYRKKYRSVLSTYLEIGAIVSNSFTRDIPPTIYTTEVVSRMIECCKCLGLTHEAVVLSQFNSNPDLIEIGVQLIISQLENLAPVGPANPVSAASTMLNTGQHNGTNVLNNNSLKMVPESFTGACGGLLTQSVLDCPDDLLNYLWEIRLIETLATSSARRGALSQLAKFRGIMDVLHSHLQPVFGCDGSSVNKCICQDLLMEQLTYFIQTSNVTNQLLQLAQSSFSSESLVDTNSVYGILAEDSSLLIWLDRILQILTKLNEELLTYIDVLTNGNAQNLLNIPIILKEIRTTVISVLCAFNLQHILKHVLFAYLSLELELTEVECDEINLFSSVITPNFGSFKSQLIQLARNLTTTTTASKSLLNLTHFYRPTFIGFIQESLTHRTKALCSENYSEHFLNSIIEYKNCVLKLHLAPLLFGRPDELQPILDQLTDNMVYRIFYSVRKSDLFSLIIEYPDSMAALLDLGQCLNHLSVRQDLITHLTEEVKQRLLHPGVHTEQILVAYSYLVRALRLVDSSFLVQDIVCRPVSACLRQREDAVRCIVDKLISAPEQDGGTDEDMKTDEYVDSTTELHQELLLPKPLEVEPLDGADDSDADLVSEDPPFDLESQPPTYSQENAPSQLAPWGHDWQPDPVEALYQKGLWRRRLDLLSMLVSIYGSKKAFLVEYKQLLSQRLLRQRNFHTARELRNLELLKLRFGGQNLHECEVMLKDIRDSKRIATLVSNEKDGETEETKIDSSQAHESSSSLSGAENSKQMDKTISDEDPNLVDAKIFPLSAYILSVHYWPELIDDRFKLPEGLRPTFNNYERCFQRLKGNRTLNWMHKLGLVNIELGLGEHSVKLDVTPLQASIAYLFTLKRVWALRDLVQELEINASLARSSLHLFVQMGYLKQSYPVAELPTKDRTDVGAEIYEVCDRVETGDSESGANPSSGNQSGSVPGDVSAIAGPSASWIYSSREDAFDPASAIATVRDRKEKELQVFWSYIVAMLTNLGGLSLDRIHSMLRMFALGSTSSLDCNRDELRQFLDRKIREGQLVHNGDIYKLVSTDN